MEKAAGSIALSVTQSALNKVPMWDGWVGHNVGIEGFYLTQAIKRFIVIN